MPSPTARLPTKIRENRINQLRVLPVSMLPLMLPEKGEPAPTWAGSAGDPQLAGTPE